MSDDKNESSEHHEFHDQPHGGGMAQRGVTRPMAEMAAQGGHDHGDDHEGDHGGGEHHMSREDRREMLAMHHKNTLWIYWSVIMLGFWLLVSPATFDYHTQIAQPSGGRSIWLSDDMRATLMTWSDILSGLLLIVFGWRGLKPDRPISLWICCFVGVWLNAAPLLFWAPTEAAYYNSTIVGALIICLTILIPGMPNMIMYMRHGNAVPPGWSYNPSSWPQRWILIAAGFAGWVVSRYLGAYQLGYIDTAWDPFFGDGSRRVLNSDMSHMWPVSDAAFGAFAYTFEFLMGWMGSPARWRTMPWMVTIFGILVIPLGLVHIVLVISQPVIVGYWCAMCLLAAGIMLPMIPLEIDEVVAMIQNLRRAKRNGESVWRAFWLGGPADDCTEDKRSPELIDLPDKPWQLTRSMFWGMSAPWTLLVSAAIGIWLMFAPTVFGLTGMAAHIDHLGGALVLTTAVICMGEVIRTGRYLNVLLGAVIALGPLFIAGDGAAHTVNNLIAGAAIVALSIPRGRITETYGAWTAYIR